MKRTGSKGHTGIWRRAAAVATVTAALSAPAAHADPADLFYERSFMLAANARCDLFGDRAAFALEAAAAQARGAALRSGVEPADLARSEARARVLARGTPCASSELAMVAGRVRNAFEAWARTPRMDFPGATASWSADRTAFGKPAWRLVQHSRINQASVSFGKAGDAGLVAVVAFPGRSRPYAARIVMRDPAMAPRPWIFQGDLRAAPPASSRRIVWASQSGPAPDDLLPQGGRSGEAWRFPAAAGEALARLDPREAFTIEFVFRDDSVARARFEAGDFVAARAFLALGAL